MNAKQACELTLRALLGRRPGALPPGLTLRQFAVQSREFRARQKWFHAGDFNGVGVSIRRTEGERTGHWAIVFYVTRKFSRSRCKFPVPPRLKCGSLPVCATDVVVVPSLRWSTGIGMCRPVRSTFSISHEAGGSGTIGFIVAERSRPAVPLLLSNAHVLANAWTATLGDRIVQPAKNYQLPSIVTRIARLRRFSGLGYVSQNQFNWTDAALASLEPGKVCDAQQPFKVSGVKRTMEPGDPVAMHGHVSQSIGEVENTLFHWRTPMDREGSPDAVEWHDLVLCSYDSKPGDSGAPVLNAQNEGMGIHMIGDEASGWSAFCPLWRIMKNWDLVLYV